MKLQDISNYAKAHERFILITLGLILVWGVSGKIQDAILHHDQAQLASRTAELQATVSVNALVAQSNAKAADDYKALTKQVLADNSRLAAESAALRDQLSRQQATDRTLPSPALAQRIETLAKLPAGSVMPAPGDTFSATRDGAVGIAVELEKVPALEGQLANAEREKVNDQKQLVAQTARVDGLDSEVKGLKTQLVQADGVCKAEIKVVKDNAAKAKRKWFVGGMILGAVARGAIKMFAGF